MKFFRLFAFILPASIFLSGCHTGSSSGNNNDIGTRVYQATDTAATPETRALFLNLLKYQDSAIMFGHQDDLAYGVGWWADDFRSDVHDVTGKFPAVFGWDAAEIGGERNIDSVSFQKIHDWIIRVYEKGGINTLSWHLDNPVTGDDAWDKTRAVYAILPGGEKHDFYKAELDTLAAFIASLKTSDGTAVPVIFRPFHELNGSWFWWGRNNCSPEEYKDLFRFTVEYLRDKKGLHNLLYAYSTDRFKTRDEYLERFPGSDYVDLLGYDDYHSFTKKSSVDQGLNSLRILAELGQEMKKPVALTETGLESIPVDTWWTENVLGPVKNDSLARKISYMLVWRNANKKHHYAPYPGHPSAPDFIAFEKDDFTWFLPDLPNMYSTGKQKN